MLQVVRALQLTNQISSRLYAQVGIAQYKTCVYAEKGNAKTPGKYHPELAVGRWKIISYVSLIAMRLYGYSQPASAARLQHLHFIRTVLAVCVPARGRAADTVFHSTFQNDRIKL